MKAYAETFSYLHRGGILPLSEGADTPSAADAVHIKKRLESCLDKERDDAWFSPLSFSFSSDHALTVALPHELFFRWFSESGKKILESTVKRCFGDITLSYTWPGHTSSNKEQVRAKQIPRPAKPHAPTFEEFIPGGKNRDAILLLRRSLHALQGPIFLHGTSGTGKSHLLHASASELGTLLEGKVHLFSGKDILVNGAMVAGGVRHELADVVEGVRLNTA